MPEMDELEARRRFAEARVGRIATASADSLPHLVPVVFAVRGDLVYSIVDAKPKRSLELKRLRNIRANPSVSLLVDHYDEDWNALWWVRADGDARVLENGPERDLAIRLLREKYPQYDTWVDPIGAAIVIAVRRWSSWSARPVDS
jgi:PPOX class probable F420-dependent enzyme